MDGELTPRSAAKQRKAVVQSAHRLKVSHETAELLGIGDEASARNLLSDFKIMTVASDSVSSPTGEIKVCFKDEAHRAEAAAYVKARRGSILARRQGQEGQAAQFAAAAEAARQRAEQLPDQDEEAVGGSGGDDKVSASAATAAAAAAAGSDSETKQEQDQKMGSSLKDLSKVAAIGAGGSPYDYPEGFDETNPKWIRYLQKAVDARFFKDAEPGTPGYQVRFGRLVSKFCAKLGAQQEAASTVANADASLTLTPVKKAKDKKDEGEDEQKRAQNAEVAGLELAGVEESKGSTAQLKDEPASAPFIVESGGVELAAIEVASEEETKGPAASAGRRASQGSFIQQAAEAVSRTAKGVAGKDREMAEKEINAAKAVGKALESAGGAASDVFMAAARKAAAEPEDLDEVLQDENMIQVFNVRYYRYFAYRSPRVIAVDVLGRCWIVRNEERHVEAEKCETTARAKPLQRQGTSARGMWSGKSSDQEVVAPGSPVKYKKVSKGHLGRSVSKFMTGQNFMEHDGELSFDSAAGISGGLISSTEQSKLPVPSKIKHMYKDKVYAFQRVRSISRSPSNPRTCLVWLHQKKGFNIVKSFFGSRKWIMFENTQERARFIKFMNKGIKKWRKGAGSKEMSPEEHRQLDINRLELLMKQAQAQQKAGHMEHAVDEYRAALFLVETLYGSDDYRVGEIFLNIADAYEAGLKSESARASLIEALPFFVANYGEEDPRTQDIRRRIERLGAGIRENEKRLRVEIERARELMAEREYEKTEAILTAALDDFEDFLSDEPHLRFEILDLLGDAAEARHDHLRATVAWTAALIDGQDAYTDEHQAVVDVKLKLSNALDHIGDLSAALDHLEAVAPFFGKKRSKDKNHWSRHPRYNTVLTDVKKLSQKVTDRDKHVADVFAQADELAAKHKLSAAILLLDKLLDELGAAKDIKVRVLRRKAVIYSNSRNSFAEAIEALKRALRLSLDYYGQDDPRCGDVAVKLAEAYRKSGNLANALDAEIVAAQIYLTAMGEEDEKYQQVLERIKDIKGTSNPGEVAATVERIDELLKDGDFEGAKELLRGLHEMVGGHTAGDMKGFGLSVGNSDDPQVALAAQAEEQAEGEYNKAKTQLDAIKADSAREIDELGKQAKSESDRIDAELANKLAGIDIELSDISAKLLAARRSDDDIARLKQRIEENEGQRKKLEEDAVAKKQATHQEVEDLKEKYKVILAAAEEDVVTAQTGADAKRLAEKTLEDATAQYDAVKAAGQADVSAATADFVDAKASVKALEAAEAALKEPQDRMAACKDLVNVAKGNVDCAKRARDAKEDADKQLAEAQAAYAAAVAAAEANVSRAEEQLAANEAAEQSSSKADARVGAAEAQAARDTASAEGKVSDAARGVDAKKAALQVLKDAQAEVEECLQQQQNAVCKAEQRVRAAEDAVGADRNAKKELEAAKAKLRDLKARQEKEDGYDAEGKGTLAGEIDAAEAEVVVAQEKFDSKVGMPIVTYSLSGSSKKLSRSQNRLNEAEASLAEVIKSTAVDVALAEAEVVKLTKELEVFGDADEAHSKAKANLEDVKAAGAKAVETAKLEAANARKKLQAQADKTLRDAEAHLSELKAKPPVDIAAAEEAVRQAENLVKAAKAAIKSDGGGVVDGSLQQAEHVLAEATAQLEAAESKLVAAEAALASAMEKVKDSAGANEVFADTEAKLKEVEAKSAAELMDAKNAMAAAKSDLKTIAVEGDPDRTLVGADGRLSALKRKAAEAIAEAEANETADSDLIDAELKEKLDENVRELQALKFDLAKARTAGDPAVVARLEARAKELKGEAKSAKEQADEEKRSWEDKVKDRKAKAASDIAAAEARVDEKAKNKEAIQKKVRDLRAKFAKESAEAEADLAKSNPDAKHSSHGIVSDKLVRTTIAHGDHEAENGRVREALDIYDEAVNLATGLFGSDDALTREARDKKQSLESLITMVEDACKEVDGLIAADDTKGALAVIKSVDGKLPAGTKRVPEALGQELMVREGTALSMQGDHKGALAAWEKACKACERAFGPEDVRIAAILLKMALEHEKVGVLHLAVSDAKDAAGKYLAALGDADNHYLDAKATVRRLEMIMEENAAALERDRLLGVRTDAASVVQSKIRGLLGRGRYKRLKERKEKELHAAARSVQTQFRANLGRKKLREARAIKEEQLKHAATRTQSHFRSFLARRKFREAKELKDKLNDAAAAKIRADFAANLSTSLFKHADELEKAEKLASAMRIQSVFRGNDARHMMRQALLNKDKDKQQLAAALMVQSSWRGHKARLEKERLKQEKDRMRTKAAAIKVQCAWRARKAHQRKLKLRALQEKLRAEGAALMLQCAWRARKAKAKYDLLRAKRLELELEGASILVQCAWRTKKAREVLKGRQETYRLLQEWAATRLQAGFRARQARRKRFQMHADKALENWRKGLHLKGAQELADLHLLMQGIPPALIADLIFDRDGLETALSDQLNEHNKEGGEAKGGGDAKEKNKVIELKHLLFDCIDAGFRAEMDAGRSLSARRIYRFVAGRCARAKLVPDAEEFEAVAKVMSEGEALGKRIDAVSLAFADAESLYESGDISGAASALVASIVLAKSRPDLNVEALTRLGSCQVKNKQLKEATSSWAAALAAVDPLVANDDPRKKVVFEPAKRRTALLTRLGQGQFQLGDLEQALGEFDLARDALKESEAMEKKAAQLDAAKGKLTAAEAALASATEKFKDSAGAAGAPPADIAAAEEAVRQAKNLVKAATAAMNSDGGGGESGTSSREVGLMPASKMYDPDGDTASLKAAGETALQQICDQASADADANADDPIQGPKIVRVIKKASDMMVKWYGVDDPRCAWAVLMYAKALAGEGEVHLAIEAANTAFERYGALYGFSDKRYIDIFVEWKWILTLADEDDNPIGDAMGAAVDPTSPRGGAPETPRV